MPALASEALLVPFRDAERALRAARAAGILDASLKIQRTPRGLLLPVARVPPSLGDAEGSIAFEAARGSFEATETATGYRDLLPWSSAERARLPGAFDVVGDIALLRLPEELRERWAEAGEALMRQHRSVRVVLHDGGVEGPWRVRAVEHVAGERRTVTEHREHGMRLRVDVAAAYFSPRLATERWRVARAVGEGERVLDMFAGVGPFAILIAREAKPRRVVAVDANADAVRWLEENVRAHKVEDVVEPRWGLAEEVVPTLEPVDRVLMNLPHGAAAFLRLAVGALRQRGVVHHYEVAPADEVGARAEARRREVAALPGVASCVLRGAHVVRAYAPHQVVVGMDFAVERERGRSA